MRRGRLPDRESSKCRGLKNERNGPVKARWRGCRETKKRWLRDSRD